MVDGGGKVVAEIAKTDLTKFEQLGLKKAEMFTYKAADGQTTLHGVIQHSLAAALNAMTGERVALAHGQDPDGLRSGIAVWRPHAPR